MFSSQTCFSQLNKYYKQYSKQQCSIQPYSIIFNVHFATNISEMCDPYKLLFTYSAYLCYIGVTLFGGRVNRPFGFVCVFVRGAELFQATILKAVKARIEEENKSMDQLKKQYAFLPSFLCPFPSLLLTGIQHCSVRKSFILQTFVHANGLL